MEENEELHIRHLVDQSCIDCIKEEMFKPRRRSIEAYIDDILADREKGLSYPQLSAKYGFSVGGLHKAIKRHTAQ